MNATPNADALVAHIRALSDANPDRTEEICALKIAEFPSVERIVMHEVGVRLRLPPSDFGHEVPSETWAWVEENIHGGGHAEIGQLHFDAQGQRSRDFVFVFNKVEDAVLFKLRWHGA